MSKSLAEVITTQLRPLLTEARAREIGAMAAALDNAIGDTPLQELEDSTVVPALAALFAYHFQLAKARKAARNAAWAARSGDEMLHGNVPYLSLLNEEEVTQIVAACDAPDPHPIPSPLEEAMARIQAEMLLADERTGGSIQ